MPASPTSELLAECAALQAKSWSDPEDDNEAHRAYAMKDSELFDLYCRAHRRQSFLERHASRYPRDINFSQLPARIVSHIDTLVDILRAPHGNTFYNDTAARFTAAATAGPSRLQSLMNGATAG